MQFQLNCPLRKFGIRSARKLLKSPLSCSGPTRARTAKSVPACKTPQTQRLFRLLVGSPASAGTSPEAQHEASSQPCNVMRFPLACSVRVTTSAG